MNIRKEKEKEFFTEHLPVFVKLKLVDPHFIIKTAFFQKGKFGRQVQFFDSEIGKGNDVYIEFYDNVTDEQGKVINIIPFNDDRQLFKYKFNPFYKEELETKDGVSSKGEPYILYTVATSELTAVMQDGTEITYSAYEKMKESDTAAKVLENPKEQNSLFPDFEAIYDKKEEIKIPSFKTSELDIPISEMTLRDFAAIMLLQESSKKAELNELINKSKSKL